MTNKINHPELDQLQAYLDQALPENISRSIQHHLDDCQLCREELSRLNNLIFRLESLPEISFATDLSAGVLQRLKENKRLSSRITWTLVLEAVGAGAVIGALIPAFQAAAWLPQILNTRQEVLASLSTFLTQLASSWLVWWAQLQINLKVLIDLRQIQLQLPSTLLTPWILILAAGGLGIIANFILLRTNPVRSNNHHQ